MKAATTLGDHGEGSDRVSKQFFRGHQIVHSYIKSIQNGKFRMSKSGGRFNFSEVFF